jgi:hypothetical protein
MKTQPDNHCRCSKCIEQEKETAAAPTPWSSKSEAYWHDQYQLMREKYWKENSDQAERIKDLTFLVTELQPKKDAAERIRELEEQRKVKEFLFNQAAKELESEQVENHKLRCALSHIVDWCPEPSDYVKDEYIRLFRNAIATARELLRKTKVEEGAAK